MQFLKFTSTVTDQEWIEENKVKEVFWDRKEEISGKTESRNDSKEEFFFVTEIKGSNVKGASLVPDGENASQHVEEFLQRIGVPADAPTLEEITFDDWYQRLKCASNRSFVEDKDRVMERTELAPLTDRFREPFFRDYSIWEFILNDAESRESLLRRAEELPSMDTLAPELARIFECQKTANVKGHPVHYLVTSDAEETQNQFTTALGEALYKNGRIGNRRCCCADLRFCGAPPTDWLEALYKSSTGGMLILRLASCGDSDEGDHASAFTAVAAAVGEYAQKYRNRVLTVFSLPRTCEKEKGILYENLGNMGIIELQEDLLTGERAKVFLKRLAKENGVRSDGRLVRLAAPGQTYLPAELRELFEEWFNEKLKTSVYPQYKTMAVNSREAAKRTSKGSAWDELQEMIGLSEAKSVIGKALDYYKLQRMYKDRGVKQDRPAMHMVFTGNPGTAKTTTARLFAKIMKENGLLSKGHLVEVGRSDLVGKYVGWTAKTVQEKFKTAMGGVLFIDEAYALADGRGGSFGDEAINTIVQEMENRREDLVVIFAGYPEEMETFLDKNPGLRSRIAFHVPFADYSADELCAIAALIGKQKGVSLSDGAKQKLHTAFETARQQPDFGNGRCARNLIEQAKMNMASRILAMDAGEVTKQTLTCIEETDIDLPEVKIPALRSVIGFIA